MFNPIKAVTGVLNAALQGAEGLVSGIEKTVQDALTGGQQSADGGQGGTDNAIGSACKGIECQASSDPNASDTTDTTDGSYDPNNPNNLQAAGA